MAPTTEKVERQERTASTGPSYGRCGTLDRVIRANEIPPTSSTTDSTTSDQASQAAARVLIPPTPSTLISCPFVTKPLYSYRLPNVTTTVTRHHLLDRFCPRLGDVQVM